MASGGMPAPAVATAVGPVGVAIPVPTTGLGQPRQFVNSAAAGIIATAVDVTTSSSPQGQVIVNAVPTGSPEAASGCPTVSATPISIVSEAGLTSERLRSLALGALANFHESLITRGVGEFLAAADLLRLGACHSAFVRSFVRGVVSCSTIRRQQQQQR